MAPRDRGVWRRLDHWPYPETDHRSDPFRTSFGQSLDMLEREVSTIGGAAMTIGVVVDDRQLYLDGTFRTGWKALHPGAEVSFEHPDRGRLVFHTDVFPSVHANIHAIALSLESLRRVDRYGITQTGEQYAGWAALPPGELPAVERMPDAENGRLVAADHGGLKSAIRTLHPDRQGGVTLPEYLDVMAFKEAIGA